MVPILCEGDTIKLKDGKTGVVFYINRIIKYYQVMCRDDYHEMIPFSQVKKKSLIDGGNYFLNVYICRIH